MSKKYCTLNGWGLFFYFRTPLEIKNKKGLFRRSTNAPWWSFLLVVVTAVWTVVTVSHNDKKCGLNSDIFNKFSINCSHVAAPLLLLVVVSVLLLLLRHCCYCAIVVTALLLLQCHCCCCAVVVVAFIMMPLLLWMLLFLLHCCCFTVVAAPLLLLLLLWCIVLICAVDAYP